MQICLFYKVKDFHMTSAMPSDVVNKFKELHNIDLNFFLSGTEDKDIQCAINNFISCRLPFAIKVFTDKDRLPCYVNEGGVLIECPHDFMRRNVRDFITYNEDIM